MISLTAASLLFDHDGGGKGRQRLLGFLARELCFVAGGDGALPCLRKRGEPRRDCG